VSLRLRYLVFRRIAESLTPLAETSAQRRGDPGPPPRERGATPGQPEAAVDLGRPARLRPARLSDAQAQVRALGRTHKASATISDLRKHAPVEIEYRYVLPSK
jgi:hypothetical protein